MGDARVRVDFPRPDAYRAGMAREGAPPLDIVLDTSVFTNPASARQWGASAEEALRVFLELARGLEEQVRFFMPPSIHDELKAFCGEGLPADFDFVVRLLAPNRFDVLVPGFLLYEIIEDLRERIDRGLRVAEKAVREAQPANLDAVIRRLRDQYRKALRAGLLDSREDVDLILLARELPAALVSSDQGVVKWAEKMGIRLIEPTNLRESLERIAGLPGA